jgi:RimJ/RimL family protein N-acetyltransferase
MSSITAIADAWWARDFACSSTELRPTRTRVQQHAGALLDNPGIWILVAGGAPLVSLPSDTLNVLGDLAQSWSVSDVADAAGLHSQLVSVCKLPVDKIIGPAFIGYGSLDSLDLRDAQLARQFSSEEAIGRLQAACQPEEWDHGGSQPHPERTFGVVDPANELLALSGYKIWNDSIAHISIVTHPAQRGRSFGRAAVARAAQHALGAGLLPQYRTLRQNSPSMGIAKRLGFIEYGFSVYVRLRADRLVATS